MLSDQSFDVDAVLKQFLLDLRDQVQAVNRRVAPFGKNIEVIQINAKSSEIDIIVKNLDMIH